MRARVLWQANQEGAPEDLERMGTFPQEGIDRLTRDLLVSGQLFKDFVVVADGQTGISVSPGTFYRAGVMYVALAEEARSLVEWVPLTAGQKRILTIVVQGVEAAGAAEARNQETEVALPGGGTATQLVPTLAPRTMVRTAVVGIIAGAVSSIPTAPAVPLDAAAVADILIGTGGIELITRRTEFEAPELDELARTVTAQAEELTLLGRELGGIRNDLAALGRRLEASASSTTIAYLAADVARLKDLSRIPDTGTPYGADDYMDDAEANTAHPDYNARRSEGLRFPYDGLWRGPLALYNANDNNLMHAAQGIICPKYTAVDGINVAARAGSVPLGGTTYQTMELKRLSMARTVVRYGDYFNVSNSSSWWQSGQYDPAKGIFRRNGETYEVDDVDKIGSTPRFMLRLRRYWVDTIQEPYNAYAPVTQTISGVIKAQTFVQSQDRWCPGTFLYLDSWAAGAEITATLVECDEGGRPLAGRMLAKTTLAAAGFRKFPQKTVFPFEKPIFLRKGIYAIVYATTGEVQAAYTLGGKFLGGTLFDNTDGVYFAGDLTKDLCFGVQYCRFDVTRLPVLLTGLTLAGGIHNMTIRTAMVAPENSAATFQLQVGDGWRDISDPGSDDTLFGTGVTPFYAFRVNLEGNQWAMPVIDMGASEVELFRSAAAMRDISAVYTFPVGYLATTVKVRMTVAAFDPARHTIAPRLGHGASHATLKLHSAVTVKPSIDRDDAVEMEWTYTFSPGVNSIRLDTVGTTNNARITPHVERMDFAA